MSSTTGGQRNVAGILFQLLATLRNGLDLLIETVALDPEGADALLITVEPDDGGDAQAASTRVRYVDQMKMRRGAADWTSREIAREVVRDLLLAADRSDLPTRYRFVTDRARGSEAFGRFLVAVAAMKEDEEHGLAEVAGEYRWGQGSVSAAAFFDRICAELDAVAKDRRRSVWRLLTRMTIVEVTEDRLRRDIDAMLDTLVEEREAIEGKRRELMTAVLEWGATGRPVKAASVLRDAGLDPKRLTHAARVPAICAAQVAKASRSLRYDADLDVRAAPSTPLASLTILSGDSGQGKTWLLCALARRLTEEGRCALLLPAVGTIDSVEREIKRSVWHPSYDRDVPLSAVAARLGPALAGADGIWLSLLLDELSDPGLARALGSGPWSDLGIRVVATVQPDMAAMFGQISNDHVDVAVPDFSMTELREYLRRCGRDYRHIPDDVLTLMLKPVLASIYGRLPNAANWRPNSEYDLMAFYFRWATEQAREQALHPVDGAMVKALAGTVITQPASYPWDLAVTRTQGLDPDTRRRLVRVGLLAEVGGGRLAASHDRILNWAVASHLADEVDRGTLDEAGVHEALVRIEGLATAAGERIGYRLGYVLHDLLWMLARGRSPAEVARIALLCVRSEVAGHGGNHFFEQGLGSLGEPIIPVLVAMAREPSEGRGPALAKRLSLAMIAVAGQEESAVAEAATSLISSPEEQTCDVGLRTLAVVPAQDALDQLWRLNCDRDRALRGADQDARGTRYAEKERAFDALVAAARRAPSWVGAAVGDVADPDEALQLVWLLQKLDVRDGRPIWLTGKHRLFALLPENTRGLARAVRHFLDEDELPRIAALALRPECDETDPARFQDVWYAEVTAFDALARLRPLDALDILPRLDRKTLRGTTAWWFPGLALRTGVDVSHALPGGSEDIGAPWDPTSFLDGVEDLLDPHTVDVVLDALERRLSDDERSDDQTASAPRHHLRLLTRVGRPELLARIAARAGTGLEAVLARAAIGRNGRVGRWVDDEGRLCRDLLGLIGGTGYDDLVLAELDRENGFARQDGIAAATWSEDGRVRAKLEELAGTPQDDIGTAVFLMKALAAHGSDHGLRLMVEQGSAVYLAAVDIRDGGPPVGGELLEDIKRKLGSTVAEERLQGINLVGFCDARATAELLEPVICASSATDKEISLAIGVATQRDVYIPECLARVAPIRDRDERGRWIARNLALVGDAAARAVVVEWFRGHPLTSLSSDELPIAFSLLQHEDSADGARDFIARVWRAGLAFGDRGAILRVLREGGDAEASAALERLPYEPSHHGPGEAVDAIRALALERPEDAMAAAERIFRRDRASAAAEVVLRLDPIRGTSLLMTEVALATIPDRWLIARLLRRRAPSDVLTAALARLAASPEAGERVIAAEIGGWMPVDRALPFLAGLVDDPDFEVELAAIAAVRRRRAEAAAMQVMRFIPKQPKTRRRAWLRAVIKQVDPDVLVDPDDPASIRPMLDGMEPEYAIEADEMIKRRREEVAKMAVAQETKRQR